SIVIMPSERPDWRYDAIFSVRHSKEKGEKKGSGLFRHTRTRVRRFAVFPSSCGPLWLPPLHPTHIPAMDRTAKFPRNQRRAVADEELFPTARFALDRDRALFLGRRDVPLFERAIHGQGRERFGILRESHKNDTGGVALDRCPQRAGTSFV